MASDIKNNMKKIYILVLGISFCLLLIYSAVVSFILIAQNNENIPFDNLKCISTFSVARADLKTNPEILPIEQFTSFRLGVFSGKIVNYKPDQKDRFAQQIEAMMKNQQIITFVHLGSSVCLTSSTDTPEGGITLNYQIQHKYCTNSCNTSEYPVTVILSANGSFVGYSNP